MARIAGLTMAVALMAAFSSPLLAQDQPRREWPSASHRWAPQNPDCTCRAQGRDFRMGEMICMRTADGARLATCGMVLNNSSWNLTDTPCTISALVQ